MHKYLRAVHFRAIHGRAYAANKAAMSKLPPHNTTPTFTVCLSVPLTSTTPPPPTAAPAAAPAAAAAAAVVVMTFLNCGESTAARPTAPLGSTTSFMRSKTSFIAATISPSSTVTTSSTLSRTIGQVRSPILALSPSAMVSGTAISDTSVPRALEAAVSAASPAAPTGSAATTAQRGLTPFTAVAMPEIMPPPDMGTTTTFRSGT
mmetsp:Transcript_41496/g.66539  ORF Transcript_41496/g.66539 Transcript_41496/m.66539 type:complete len:205 (-) Transcript_41496:131-745(-)